MLPSEQASAKEPKPPELDLAGTKPLTEREEPSLPDWIAKATSTTPARVQFKWGASGSGGKQWWGGLLFHEGPAKPFCIAADDGDFIPVSQSCVREMLSDDTLVHDTEALDPLKGGWIKGKAAPPVVTLAHTPRAPKVAGSLVGMTPAIFGAKHTYKAFYTYVGTFQPPEPASCQAFRPQLQSCPAAEPAGLLDIPGW